MNVLRRYKLGIIDSIIEAFKMLFSGEITMGNIMVISGCFLFVLVLPIFFTSFGRFARQRKRMLEKMKKS